MYIVIGRIGKRKLHTMLVSIDSQRPLLESRYFLKYISKIGSSISTFLCNPF